MTTINAIATRLGDWWAAEFISPQEHRLTQVKRLDQAPAMSRRHL
ncbi:hypothetical protein HMPREF1531_00905 [Propionibacterium sp. oral taxon 192 str. F0372]|nr:hypothetical protein [Propionibacterium sp. oral taxon 192]EPH06255.1 hypothetical protein HMPREF1531_00905 [Propionibacterium sp. oral taxon 192 str. F0372]